MKNESLDALKEGTSSSGVRSIPKSANSARNETKLQKADAQQIGGPHR